MGLCLECGVLVFGLNKRCDACKKLRIKEYSSKWKELNREASRLHSRNSALRNAERLAEYRIKNRLVTKARDLARRNKVRGGPPRTHDTTDQKKEKGRAKYQARYAIFKDRDLARSKEWHIQNPLSNGDVAYRMGLKVADCTPELIATKREQILLHRALRELNKTLKEQNGN